VACLAVQRSTFNVRHSTSVFLTLAGLSLCAPARAAIPAPEKLLPDDTLLLLTAPDFTRLASVWRALPQRQLWDDPAMKPFRDGFVSKWQEEFLQPLERELDLKCENYSSLAQGQITFALTQNGWQGDDKQNLGVLFLLDTKDKSGQLKQNLADLRKKWVDAGKKLRTEKVREVEFTVIPLSSNDVPKNLRGLFPSSPPTQELGDENQPKKPAPATELVIGQADSLLILASSTKVAEKVLARMAGSSAPVLGDQATYQANHQALFRDAPAFGWVNLKALIDAWTRAAAAKKENPDAPNPFDIQPDKLLAALGFSGLKSFAFSFQNPGEGTLFQCAISVPESSRQGLFKILAGEPKEFNPPSFVPANAVKFRRWRIDGQKAWATLQKTLGDLSPQGASFLDYILDSANQRAKEKDPDFDIRKNLIGNLGDDFVTYEKAHTGSAASGPGIFLLGSPKPEAFVAALKGLLVILPQGETVAQREFLGRKIYSVPLPAGGLFPGAGAAAHSAPQTLHFAASSSYVALATDASIIEEYLRSGDSQAKALRELPGLTDAAQKVTGPGTSLFGYENDVETMRTAFETLRKAAGSPSASSNNPAASAILPAVGLGNAAPNVKDWLDFSLLPPFDKVARYFSFSVYGGSASVDGLTFKMFAPVPPALKAPPPAPPAPPPAAAK
jgi:hypothetical protein